MQLEHNYWYFTKAVDKETCDKIISMCLMQKHERGSIGKLGKNGKIKADYRDCKVSWISSEWIYNILNPFIDTANKKAGWNFQWDWNEPSQFTSYEKDDHYNWHNDQVKYGEDENKNFKNKIRKLSLTLQLTEPTKYEGGDLQIKYFNNNTVKKDTLTNLREVGTVIIFPSFVWHRITPITKGKRQSLVNWSLGKPFE